MSIETVLRGAGLSPWVDARASHRRGEPPKRLSVVHLGDAEDTQQAISAAVALESPAILLVMASGGVLVLSEGGYGPIAVQGSQEQMTEGQVATLAIVSEALSRAYGIEGAAPAKKRARKQTEEPVVEQAYSEPADEEPADA